MIRRSWLIILTLLLFTSCKKQLDTKLWFEQASRQTIEAHEASAGGEQVETRIAKNAIQFLRSSDEELTLKVRYYLDGDKATKVMYEWSKIVPGLDAVQLDSIMLAESNNINAYHAKFDQIAEVLTEEYGVPLEGDGHLKKERFEMLDMWKRNFIWKRGEQVTELKLVWIPKVGYRVFKVYVETTWPKE